MIAHEATHPVSTNMLHSKDASCVIVVRILTPMSWLYVDAALALCTIESSHEPEAHDDDKSRKAGWNVLKSQDPLCSGTHC